MGDVMLVKIVTYFLENQHNAVYLRELAKILRISPYTAKQYMDMLVREGLVHEERRANLRYFKANAASLVFRHLKIALNLKKLIDAGIVKYLQDTVPNTSSIVLFGSLAKGEDTAESDIDLVVIGKKIRLDIEVFEGKLKKSITVHIFSWSDWKRKFTVDVPFYYEVIIHGIALFGEPPVIT